MNLNMDPLFTAHAPKPARCQRGSFPVTLLHRDYTCFMDARIFKKGVVPALTVIATPRVPRDDLESIRGVCHCERREGKCHVLLECDRPYKTQLKNAVIGPKSKSRELRMFFFFF